VAVHGGLFLDENASCPLGVLVGAIRGRAVPDEEGLEEAVCAEADVRDEPARAPQPLHRLRHLLRRRVPAGGIVLGGYSRCRRLSLLHLALLASIRLTLGLRLQRVHELRGCVAFFTRDWWPNSN
jgi:hypothetical protein